MDTGRLSWCCLGFKSRRMSNARKNRFVFLWVTNNPPPPNKSGCEKQEEDGKGGRAGTLRRMTKRGRKCWNRLLESQRAEAGGQWPETVAVVLWGTDNIKTYGESLAQVMRPPPPRLRLPNETTFASHFLLQLAKQLTLIRWKSWRMQGVSC